MALEALDNLAKALQTPGKLVTIGGMAAEMIRGKIHKGDGFAALSPATAAYRGAGRPLQDTGALRDSITFKVVDERTVSVGTNKPYATIQNNGGVIRAKKNWLWIPAVGTRQLQRRYGYSPTDVLKGLKAEGYSIFRKGRTMCYREKRKKRNESGRLQNVDHVLYYLKKSVEIPARPFFFLSDNDMDLLMREVGSALEQL
ncbi:MAG: phage virion morphogenesis protein [Treponema sp.]|jgi:phage gpG-like protein|nr:phage virion morphogenesis protein [Treponema sp.]